MTREAVAILEASRMIPLIDVSVSGETSKVKEVTRRDRILAASVGATLTSLTSASILLPLLEAPAESTLQ